MGKNSKENSKKFNIGLDLDGVIVDHTKNKIIVAKQLGFSIEKNDTPSGVFERLIPKKEYRELQRIIYGEMSLTATPVPHAVSTIRRLVHASHKLFIISRRYKNSKEGSLWLRNNNIYKWIPKRNIMFVQADSDKALYAKKFGLDIFLDDKTKVLFHLRSIVHPVLFNNYSADINQGGYTEVCSWRDFFDFVKSYE